MNKPQKKESVNNADISPYLKGIQSELSDIKKLMFQRTIFQLNMDSETLTALIKSKEKSNGKSK